MARPFHKTGLQSESSVIGTLKANTPPQWPLDCPDCGTRMEFRSGAAGRLQRACLRPGCNRVVTEADLLNERKEAA